MTQLTVSTKGQIVLPAEVRRRLGLGPGAKLEMSEVTGALVLRPVRTVASAKIAACVGMVRARSSGPGRLEDFDVATLLERRAKKP